MAPLAVRARPHTEAPWQARPEMPDRGQEDLRSRLGATGAAQPVLILGRMRRLDSTAIDGKGYPMTRSPVAPGDGFHGDLKSFDQSRDQGGRESDQRPGEAGVGSSETPMRMELGHGLARMVPAIGEGLPLVPGHEQGDPGDAEWL